MPARVRAAHVSNARYFLSRSVLPFAHLRSLHQRSWAFSRWYVISWFWCRDLALTNDRNELLRNDGHSMERVRITGNAQRVQHDGAMSTSRRQALFLSWVHLCASQRCARDVVCTQAAADIRYSRNITYSKYCICLKHNCPPTTRKHHVAYLVAL